MYTAVVVCGVLSGYVGSMIAMERTIPQLKVQQIDIISHDKVVATLGTTKGSGSLYLNYDNGRPAIVLGTASKQPGLSLMDEKGRSRAGAAIGNEGSGIWLSNGKGKDLITICVKGNNPSVTLRGSKSEKEYKP